MKRVLERAITELQLTYLEREREKEKEPDFPGEDVTVTWCMQMNSTSPAKLQEPSQRTVILFVQRQSRGRGQVVSTLDLGLDKF